jgi:hypothetical protein
MKEALAVLKRDGSTEAIVDRLATFQERDRVVGLGDWQELDGRYVKRDGDEADGTGLVAQQP